ncbi:MAG TPA: two-component regulator propeller domain-containing protein [Parafilimonas sp.]|nr:two-component regulator propeller domain-containing protein [Parafilimonas sp.]
MLIYAAVFSQQQRQYAFTHFNTANGLVANTVFDVVQDKQGYIWLATVDGLQRYDGNKFLTFRRSSVERNSITGDFLTQLTEDKDGNLWVYDGAKIGYFNTKTFAFTLVPIENEDPANPYDVRFYGNAANGYITLYIQDKGFFTYNPAKKIFEQKIAFKFGKRRLYNIADINNGAEYWMGGYGGLVIYNTKTNNLNYRGHNPDNNPIVNYLKNDTVTTDLYTSNNNNIWFGTWPPVAYAPFINSLNLKTGERKLYKIGTYLPVQGYFEIGGALFQQNGRKWFYGRSFIAEFTGNDSLPFQFIQNGYTGEQSISFDRVFKMIEDRQHNVWIATDNGVYVFNPDMQVFNSYKLQRVKEQPTEGGVTNICELKNGNVLITTWGRGLYYYDNKFNALPLPRGMQELTRSYMMWCVHQHSKTGVIWFGMQAGEMAVYDPATHKLQIFANPIFNGKTIRQITEDAYGNLWFGLQSGGIVKWNMKAANNDCTKGYETIQQGRPYYVQEMCTGTDGAIWVAYLNDGLYKYDPITNKLLAHYAKSSMHNNGLWSNSVNDVYFYNDSLLLIADGALDLLNVTTNKIIHISTENGLPSNTVLSVEADDQGILWLGMANQLCRFDLQRKIFSTFDRRDGISYDLFNVAGDYKMRDGRMVYLTDKNFVVFKPKAISDMVKSTNVVITSFTLENKALPVDSLNKFQTIDLKYNNTSVSIEFSALNYTPQNKLHYYYMLDGLDKSWILSSNLNEAVYNYLPSGDYTFKVKAENAEGKESNITELHLRVIPPFWQTWWFLGLLALAVIAIFYLFDRERIRKLQALQKMRTQIAGDLHENVNATLNNINLLSEMAKIKAGKDVERSKEYIDQITDKSRRMIDVMDDMLWSLKPENDSMEKTVLRMQEYAEGLQRTHETKIKMNVDEKVKAIKPDMKTRHEIFFIFKEVITALSKQAKGTESLIDIDLIDGKLLLKIQNTGIHFITGTDTALVRKEILQHAQSINAELDIQNDSKGVSVILLIAVK